MVALLLLDKSSFCQNNRATKTRNSCSGWPRPGNLKAGMLDSGVRFFLRCGRSSGGDMELALLQVLYPAIWSDSLVGVEVPFKLG